MKIKSDALVDYMNTLVGTKQGSKAHKRIVDKYNTLDPLPRGYRVTYTDNWCAVFATVMMMYIGKASKIAECSAQKMLDKCKKNKFVLTTKQKPKPKDIVFYDWDKNGISNHVGIVSDYDSKSGLISVIEGNKNHAIGVRIIKADSEKILAIARVK